MKDQILLDFKNRKRILDAFGKRVSDLLVDLLVQKGIVIHQINNRTKDYDSLSKKIDTKGKYKSLGDITDLVWIRIITYLESEVDKVADLIRGEFEIDKKNCIDKRVGENNKFGYKSLHMVVSLSKNRSKLVEYGSYQGLKCEIQIRSILQHAWAEIEHDLWYKSTVGIPDNVSRSFNRLSALLETADIEFDRLKKEITSYEKEVVNQIKNNPQEVFINQASLSSFISTNPIINEAKNLIWKKPGVSFYQKTDLSGIIENFRYLQIFTIKELEDELKSNHQHFIRFVSEFISNRIYLQVPSSAPVFFFQHFLITKTEDAEKIRAYRTQASIIPNSKEAIEWLIETYRKTKVRPSVTK